MLLFVIKKKNKKVKKDTKDKEVKMRDISEEYSTKEEYTKEEYMKLLDDEVEEFEEDSEYEILNLNCYYFI